MATGNSNSWIKALQQLIEAILHALGQGQQSKRSWHQHVVPYEEGWAVT